MSDTPSPDTELQRLVTRALDGTVANDLPVPPSVTAGSLWIHEFHNMDAELAAANEPTPREVGSRASGDRVIFFSFAEHDVEVRLQRAADGSVDVNGQIAPSAAGTVRGSIGGRPAEASIDNSGRFSIEASHAGATAVVMIQLDTTTLRLEPFTL